MKKIEPIYRSQASGTEERKRLLYVEDEDDNWDVTLLRLGQRYSLIRAKDAESACNFVKNFHQGLYAILMDIQLHGSALDGIQLTKLFRGSLPRVGLPAYAADVPVISTPIVFVTAYGARYSEADLLGVGGNLLVTKPVDFVKLTLGLANMKVQQVWSSLKQQK